VLIHLVDAASTEGRDPINDIHAINAELEKYGIRFDSKPQVIAANKIDVMNEVEQETVLELIREEMEPLGIPVFPISAVSGAGINELLWHINKILKELPQEITEFEQEYNPMEFMDDVSLPFEVTYDEAEDEYVVEGPRIERMLGYTNLESEKGFQFFQDFLKKNGILKQLEDLGIQDGDTVRLYGLSFDYYK
jgi:GTP-binding protein